MKTTASISEIKLLLKEHGYQFNRWWRIPTSVGTLTNSRLGGWPGMELSISGGQWRTCHMLRNMSGSDLAVIYNALEEDQS